MTSTKNLTTAKLASKYRLPHSVVAKLLSDSAVEPVMELPWGPTRSVRYWGENADDLVSKHRKALDARIAATKTARDTKKRAAMADKIAAKAAPASAPAPAPAPSTDNALLQELALIRQAIERLCAAFTPSTLVRDPTISVSVSDVTPGHIAAGESDRPWVKWRGGSCPVPAHTAVDIKYRDGDTGAGAAGSYNWHHIDHPGDIVAYREREPFSDPRPADAASLAACALGGTDD